MPALTDRIPLGDGLAVSPACLGMCSHPSVVVAAYDAGLNFFFITADMHWPLYEATRRGLIELLATRPEARDHIVVAGVAYVTQPEFCWAPFEELVEAIPGLHRLDVTVAGGAYGREVAARLPAFAGHRDHWNIRATGISFHDRESARELITSDRVDLAYVRYNPVHAGAATEVYAHAKPRTEGRRCLIYNFKSTIGHLDDAAYAQLGIGDDFWHPHVTDYYRFALTQPAVDGVLCALPHPGAVRDLADALAKGPLSEDDHQYLLDLGALAQGTAKLAS